MPPCFVSTLPHSYQPLALPLAPLGALLGRRMSHSHPRHTGTHPQIRPFPFFPSLTNALAAAAVALPSSVRERFVRGLRGWARKHFNPSRCDEFSTFFLFYGLTPFLHGLFAILELYLSPHSSALFSLYLEENLFIQPFLFVHQYFMTFSAVSCLSARAVSISAHDDA